MVICKHDDNVVIRKFHSEVILVPIRTAIADIDLLYTVNGNASFIWQFLDGSNDLEGVHQQMYCEFDIDPLEAKSDLEEVDEFYYGELGPLAIQGFLRFSYTDWTTPKPVYLMSFGDGHIDYFNNYATNETSLIPAFLADVDPFQGEVAADNLPDLLAGRLPVRTTAEAAAVVQKIMNYETTEPVGWNEALTFVADNADDAGQYATDTDTMISTYVPVDYSAEKIYFGITHETASAVKNALLSAINSGRLIVHYAGHSGIQKWGDENFLALGDVLALSNADKLPFVLPMTCLEGNFSYPSPVTNINKNASIGEAFVRKQSGGAIASWSPTGLGLHSGHMILQSILLKQKFIAK